MTQQYRKQWLIVGSAVFLPLLFVVSAFAATVTQDFATSGTLASGTIVSLDKQASRVVPANQKNLANLYGVVVHSGDLSFNQAAASGRSVSVANEGIVDTLVSNRGGSIVVGDPITVADVAGVGQKATGPGKIIGVAQSALDKQDARLQQFRDATGSSFQVAAIPVKVEVANYAIGINGAALSNGQNRNKILQVADNLAGKQVKAYALVVAGLLLLIVVFVATFMITSSGYASMLSIGRNPLSEAKIIKALVRMLVIAVSIFVGGLAVAYAIIKFL